MPCLSPEQKQALKSVYNSGRKECHLESHVEFLEECLEIGFIPKSFRLKNNIPGNSRINQNRLKNVSVQAISDEKESHANKLKVVKTEFEKARKI